MEEIGVACNKNTGKYSRKIGCFLINKKDFFLVPGDKSALNPSGIRLGTPALTTRGFSEKDISLLVKIIHEALQLAKEVETRSGPKLADFKRVLLDEPDIKEKVLQIRERVENLALAFPMPGYEF